MWYDQAVAAAPRFWPRVIQGDGCWSWDGAHVPDGYGSIGMGGRQHYAHRVSWALANGRWPNAMVLHRCGNRGCVRPDHLYEGDGKQNAADMVRDGTHRNIRKTHCPQGHPYDAANTIIDGRGRRCCRTCNREKCRARYVSHPRKLPTHCPQGHPYDAANTYVDKRGYRYCRECSRTRTRAWRQQQRPGN